MLASLRDDAAYFRAQSGLIAALHALILATLVRIVARLDHMVTLWAAGQLPLPAPAKPRPARTPSPRRPHTRTAQTPRTRRPQSVPTPPREPTRTRTSRPQHPQSPITASTLVGPRAQIPPQPPPILLFSLPRPTPTHAHFIT